jgi:hypothetical protein
VADWWLTKDSDLDCVELYERHYSRYRYADGRQRAKDQFVGPGEKVVLRTEHADALFVWRVFIDDSGQEGINCAVFRNESQPEQLARSYDRRIRLLIASGLIAGITPMSIRRRSPQQTLDFALSPLAGDGAANQGRVDRAGETSTNPQTCRR